MSAWWGKPWEPQEKLLVPLRNKRQPLSSPQKTRSSWLPDSEDRLKSQKAQCQRPLHLLSLHTRCCVEGRGRRVPRQTLDRLCRWGFEEPILANLTMSIFSLLHYPYTTDAILGHPENIPPVHTTLGTVSSVSDRSSSALLDEDFTGLYLLTHKAEPKLLTIQRLLGPPHSAYHPSQHQAQPLVSFSIPACVKLSSLCSGDNGGGERYENWWPIQPFHCLCEDPVDKKLRQKTDKLCLCKQHKQSHTFSSPAVLNPPNAATLQCSSLCLCAQHKQSHTCSSPVVLNPAKQLW